MGCGASCRKHPWKDFRSHPLLVKYKIHKKLGAGAFSEVWRATKLDTKEVVALKVVFWGNPSVKEHHRKILKKEVEVLRMLDHPNIVKMTDDVDDGENLIIVLEFLKGGGLLEHLFEVEHYTEAQAAYLFQQLLQAVAYMHSHNVMHRDIKPENVVFEMPVSGGRGKSERPVVKLVDFGLARQYSESRSVKARLGSPGFMAPETIEFSRHAPAMDMFSLGVLLFVMLTGHKPMKSEQARKLSYSTLEANEYLKMQSWGWKQLSQPARSLVLQLMERDPSKRMTAAQALKAEWIVTMGGTKPVDLGAAARGAGALARERRFKNMAHAVIALQRFGAMSQRRSSGVSQDVELEWAPGKGKPRPNAVVPVNGGGGTEVHGELSGTREEEEAGTLHTDGHGTLRTTTAAEGSAHSKARHVSLPSLVCEPVVAAEPMSV
eukprot:jgi/Ulvmu1/7712/UM039_0018.1